MAMAVISATSATPSRERASQRAEAPSEPRAAQDDTAAHARMPSTDSSDPEHIYTPLIGVMGAASAIIFSSLGACYGTARSGSSIAAIGVMKPQLVMKSIIPVVMAGIVAIYGLVVAILIITNLGSPPTYTLFQSLMHLGAGLTVGGAGVGAGYAIGVVGDHGVRYTVLQEKLFIPMILVLIFAEVLGLYGLILAIFLYVNSSGK